MSADLQHDIEDQMQGIMHHTLEMMKQIPRPNGFCNDGYTPPSVMINQHLNQIRKLLYDAELWEINQK